MTDRDVDAAVARLREAYGTYRSRNYIEQDERDASLVCTALAEARQQLAAQAQEIAVLREQIDVMRGEDLGGLEHIEYCEHCQRFFDSREGCPTDIRADERERSLDERAETVHRAVDAQRELDAQIAEEAATPTPLLAAIDPTGAGRDMARAIAAAIRAARTPQEPT